MVSGDSLLARIRSEIARHGPMPFDRFMQLALYDPDQGYFTAGAVRSEKGGDFLTSPEVSPLFGSTLARFVAAERYRVGGRFAVVEAGAGTGTLLRPLLDALDPPIEPHAVEVSSSARERLRAALPEARVVGSMDDLPRSFDGVIVANELLDNLPAAVCARRGGVWVERVIVVDGPGLRYDEAPARPEVAEWADRHSGPVPDGGIVEVQLAATAWVLDASGRVRRGSLVVVDYGDEADGLEHRRREGTVRTYRGHHLGPDPLLDPGSTDITMDVNFTAVSAAAREAGAAVSLYRQDEFLVGLGLDREISGLRSRELEAARAGETTARLRLRDAITGARALLHPRGLGDFRVMVARK